MSKFLHSLKHLENWFECQKRILPWRDKPTAYRVWISEVMLQQTQVKTVIPYFEKFLSRFPTVKALALASEEEVLFHWAGLGYYSRARNLHLGAKKILAQKTFPQTKSQWLTIPGVGPYTAGAIVSIAFNKPEPILDVNVERVLSRIRRCYRKKGDQAFKKRLWLLAKIFVETGFEENIKPSILNQALMELGATLCTPKNPRCPKCPLSKICRAYEHQDPESFPPQKNKKKWLNMEETMHCILNPVGEVFLRKRKKGEWRAGLWDLIEVDNTTHLPKHLCLPIPKNTFLKTLETSHTVTNHKIKRKTHVWMIKKTSLEESKECKWISIKSPQVAMGAALKKTLSLLSATQ